VKTLAFIVALVIMALGTLCIVVPAGPVWLAQHAVAPGVFCVVGTVRVAFGLVLISVAPVSRTPKTLRVLGYIFLVAGVATALTGLVAIERARAIVEWWWQQGPGRVRLTGVLGWVLGGLIAYACAPVRRAA
jgi:membrane-bound ClpP family serine protease